MSKKLKAEEIKASLKERLGEKQKRQPLVEQPATLSTTEKNGLPNVEEKDELLISIGKLMKEIDNVPPSVFNELPPSFSKGSTEPNINLLPEKPKEEKPKKEEPLPLDTLGREIDYSVMGSLDKEAAPVEGAAEAVCCESQPGLIQPVCVVEERVPHETESPETKTEPTFSEDGTTISTTLEDQRTRRPIFGIGAEIEGLLKRRDEAEQHDSDGQVSSFSYDGQTTPGEPQIKITPPAQHPPQPKQPGPNKKPKRWKRWVAGAVIAAALLASGIGIHLSSRNNEQTSEGPRLETCTDKPSLFGNNCPPSKGRVSICLTDSYTIDTQYFCDPIEITIDDEVSGCTTAYCAVTAPNFKWKAISRADLDNKIIDNLKSLLVPDTCLSVIPLDKMNDFIDSKMFLEGSAFLSFEEAQRLLTLPLDQPKNGVKPMYIMPRSNIKIDLSSLLLTVNLNGTKGDTSFGKIMKETHPSDMTVGLNTISEIEAICKKAENPIRCLGGALANLTGPIKNTIKLVGRLAYAGLLGNDSCDKRDIVLITPEGGSAIIIGYNEAEMPDARETDCKPAQQQGRFSGFGMPSGMGAATGY